MTTRTVTREAQRRLDFAAAALAVAGHEVTDPAYLDILERHAMDEVSIDDAIAEVRRIAGV